MLDFELLSISDTARAIKKSEVTVRRLIRQGFLPGVVRIGGSVQIDGRKLREFIEVGGRGGRRPKASS